MTGKVQGLVEPPASSQGLQDACAENLLAVLSQDVPTAALS